MDDPLGQVAIRVVVAGGYLPDDALVIDELTVGAEEIRVRINCERTAAVTDGSVSRRFAGKKGGGGGVSDCVTCCAAKLAEAGMTTPNTAVSSAVKRTGCRMRLMSLVPFLRRSRLRSSERDRNRAWIQGAPWA